MTLKTMTEAKKVPSKQDIKTACEGKIIDAIKTANKYGFEVAVGSDPEGNGFNTIDPKYCLYSDSNNKYIVLGVMRTLEESEPF